MLLKDPIRVLAKAKFATFLINLFLSSFYLLTNVLWHLINIKIMFGNGPEDIVDENENEGVDWEEEAIPRDTEKLSNFTLIF